MRKRRIFAVAILVVLASGILLWWLSHHLSGIVPSAPEKMTKQDARPVNATKKDEPTKKTWNESLPERLEESLNKWKTPISFYGKVVDENEQPVEGVEAHFSWTDLSPNGTSQAVALSDAQGLFLLDGVKGYFLSVDVEKEGYYTSKAKNQTGFQYADKGDRFYHVPDSSNPVIFHLRKKGEAEPMVFFERKIDVRKGETVSVVLSSDKASPEAVGLDVTLLENHGGQNKSWAMTLVLPNGGIVPATEEFPVMAPEAGFEPSLQLDLNSKLPPQWIGVYKGGRFYVKTPGGYGLVELKMVPGSGYMRVRSYYNPSGSRNLEFDESKQINKP